MAACKRNWGKPVKKSKNCLVPKPVLPFFACSPVLLQYTNKQPMNTMQTNTPTCENLREDDHETAQKVGEASQNIAESMSDFASGGERHQ
jgi:hypothetical protein